MASEGAEKAGSSGTAPGFVLSLGRQVCRLRPQDFSSGCLWGFRPSRLSLPGPSLRTRPSQDSRDSKADNCAHLVLTLEGMGMEAPRDWLLPRLPAASAPVCWLRLPGSPEAFRTPRRGRKGKVGEWGRRPGCPHPALTPSLEVLEVRASVTWSLPWRKK